LAIRAVVFDYGMVLSGPPNPEARQELHRISGLNHDTLESYYWIDRHAYDRGDLSGLAYWQKLNANAALGLADEHVSLLNHWDAKMWTTFNPAMIAWQQQLKSLGVETAILSNMGDTVLESIQASFEWISSFDVLIWSYQHNLAKPERAIYELLLDKLGTAAEETLFLDDKLENIEAARQLGIKGLVFTNVDQLRQDLISTGFDESLPLPPELLPEA
jgi:putative hydrolase of the HAD superfamily